MAGMFANRKPLAFEQAPSLSPESLDAGGLVAQPNVPAPDPSFFGAGGSGRNIAGYVGDALAQMGGLNPVYAPVMQQQRLLQQRQQMADQQYQRQRQDGMADWIAKAQYEAANPKAQAPTEFERTLIASGVQPGSPEWTAAFARKRDNTLDPWTNIVSGGESLIGRQSQVQRALMGGGDQASSGGAPAKVTSPAEFDALAPGTQFIAPDGSLRVKN